MIDEKKPSGEIEDKKTRQQQIEEVAKYNSPEGVEIYKRLLSIVSGEWKK